MDWANSGSRPGPPPFPMSSARPFEFHATVEEVAIVLLRDTFLLVQPTLTRAVRAIFVKTFGEDKWLKQFKTYVGKSAQRFVVDDGRAFPMCASSALHDDVAFLL
jgi:hypothetical protein